MKNKADVLIAELFPAHIRREVQRLNNQARDRRDRAEFFERLGYRASARRLTDEAVRLEERALRLHA